MKAVATRAWQIPSRTRPGTTHTVHLALDGALVCNCEAALNHLECWHVKYIREELEMNETQALVPIQVTAPQALLMSDRELSVIERMAKQVIGAKGIALPRELDTPEKVAAVMIYGYELGLRPMTAVRHLYIINGRVQPSAEVMAGLLQANEPDSRLQVVEVDETKCTMRLVRPSRGIDETYTVTMDEVKKAGLTSDVWTKYPRDKLRWHCTKRILRIYAPDLINSIDGVSVDAVASQLTSAPEITEAELYNPGDEAIEGESRVIEDEGVEDVPTTSEAQRSTIADYHDAIKSKQGTQALATVTRVAKGSYPYAVEDGNFYYMRLTQPDADAYIAALKAMYENVKQPPAPAPAEPTQEALV